jgi:hypothetical protein
MASGSTTKAVNDWVTVDPNDWETVGATPTPKPAAGGPPAMPRDPRAAVGNAVMDAVRNAPRSGMNFLKNITSPIHSPRQTFDAVTGTVEGGLNRGAQWLAGTLGLPNQLSADEEAQGRKFDTVVNDYKQAYGSPQQALQTLGKDPFRVAADVSMVTGGTAPLARAMGMPRAASTLNAVSQASNPVVGLPRAAMNAIPPATRNQWSASLYQRALKPPPSMFDPPEQASMINAALDDKVALPFVGNGTGAIEKVRGNIDNANKIVSAALDEGAAAGKTVDPAKVASHTNRSMERLTTVDPADKAPISGVRDRFLADHTNEYKYTKVRPAVEDGTGYVPTGEGVTKELRPIPIKEAQRLKTNTYRELRDSAYGEQVGPLREGKKDLARGLKEGVYEGLAETHPELRALGQYEKARIDLEAALEHFGKRQGNRDLINIGTPLTGGAVGATTGSGALAASAAFLSAALKNPGVLSRLAIALRAAKRLQQQPARGRQVANVAGNVQDAATEQPE